MDVRRNTVASYQENLNRAKKDCKNMICVRYGMLFSIMKKGVNKVLI